MSQDPVAEQRTAEALEARLREAMRNCAPERDRIDAPVELLAQAGWLEQRRPVRGDPDDSVAAGWRRRADRIIEAREIVAEMLFGFTCRSCGDWAAVLDMPVGLEQVAKPTPAPTPPPQPAPSAPPEQGTLGL
jgi:hypothetical protein